jgi:ferric-dicitrate binding protein FerR (iron transport regulator)
MNADTRRELEALLSAQCDGELTDAEHARLEHLLDDPACRQCYLEYMDMHARLLAHPGIGTALPPPAEAPTEVALAVVPPPSRGRFAQVLRYAAVAASTLAATILVQLWWSHSHPAADLPGEPVATLVQTADCAWPDARKPLRDGERLPTGRLQLLKGVARIRFDNGSELLVQGPAELSLDASDAATLLRGKLVFRSDAMAGPFDLHTPLATLVDLGTEYGVWVGPDGEEVQVFEGDVHRVPRAETVEPEYLQTGDAYRWGPQFVRGKKTKFDPARYVHHLAAAPDAAGLLAYEGFDYKTPDALTASKANGGRGWAGPWTVTVAQPLEWGEQKRLPLNVEESLTRPDSAVPSIGGRFDHAGFGVYYRQMTTPVRLDTDGAYYISCLFRRSGPPGHPFNMVALMLRPNEGGAAPARGKFHDHHERHHGQEPRPNLGKRLMIGAGGSNQIFARVECHCARASMPINTGQSYLLVAKVAASRLSADQVFVRVYAPREPVGTEEPVSWSMISPPFHSNLAFDWLGIHVNSKNRQMIDEIRVGTTWSSVTAPWHARVVKDKKA